MRARLHPDTLLAQAGEQAHATGHVVPPIEMSATFARDERYELMIGVDYGRDGSPAFRRVESVLAALEGGDRAMVFSSGMAAATAVFMGLRPGDHAIVPRAMYWALRRWAIAHGAAFGIDVDVVDVWNAEAVSSALRPGRTKLVWAETPANPTWEVTDIERTAAVAHDAGAACVVDSTVATPVLTRPLELGADIVMHSASKYLNGHSDVVAGALVGRADSELWSRAAAHRKSAGAILGQVEAWLLLRGMRTLAVRVARSSETALALARWLETHPRVAEVRYPGLASHPQHATAVKQMRGGFGGMLSIRVRGGLEGSLAVARALELALRATSLGGTETLVEHRFVAEGPGSQAPEDLLRISVGLEHEGDLRADFERALNHT
ncbi:MAG: PLP-dependent transferase [Polyangiaceae bacterium]